MLFAFIGFLLLGLLAVAAWMILQAAVVGIYKIYRRRKMNKATIRAQKAVDAVMQQEAQNYDQMVQSICAEIDTVQEAEPIKPKRTKTSADFQDVEIRIVANIPPRGESSRSKGVFE